MSIAPLKLLTAYYVAYNKDKSEWTNKELGKSIPIDCIDLIEYFYQYKPHSECSGFAEASQQGRLDLMKIFGRHIKNFNLGGLGSIFMQSAAVSAAAQGRIDMLKYVKENDSDFDIQWFFVIQSAIINGHTEIVDYLESMNITNWCAAARGAALGGHLKLLKLYLSKFEGFDDWAEFSDIASINGHLQIIKYCASKTEKIKWEWLMVRAGSSENGMRKEYFDIIKYCERKIKESGKSVDWKYILGFGRHLKMNEYIKERMKLS